MSVQATVRRESSRFWRCSRCRGHQLPPDSRGLFSEARECALLGGYGASPEGLTPPSDLESESWLREPAALRGDRLAMEAARSIGYRSTRKTG